MAESINSMLTPATYSMKSRIIESRLHTTEKLCAAYDVARSELQHMETPPPEELTGDLMLALVIRRFELAETATLSAYSEFFTKLVTGHRWGYLVSRLSQLASQSRTKADVWQGVLVFLGQRLSTSLFRIAAFSNSEGAMPQKPLDEVLEHIAQSYSAVAEEYDDFSEPLLDDLTMVMTELSRRLRLTDFKDLLQHKDLIESCLSMPCDQRPYAPRYLREVLRPGDRDERLPGDHFGLRGVTKKIREDQIPKVLPSELAAWRWNGSKGRHLTLDRLVNGSPPCYENYDTRRPEVDHRVLLAMLVNTPHNLGMSFAGARHAFGAAEEPSSGSEVGAKALAYALLVNAALKVPHNSVRTDVAWFQRDDAGSNEYQWAVSFPLRAFKSIGSDEASWRNLVEADRFLPSLFVRQTGATQMELAPLTIALRDRRPTDYLQRAVTSGYDAIFIVSLDSTGDLVMGLPAASLTLPRLPGNLPTVMLISSKTDDNARTHLRGQTFRDLFAARMMPAWQETGFGAESVEEHLIETFLEMIVGPLESLARREGGAA